MNYKRLMLKNRDDDQEIDLLNGILIINSVYYLNEFNREGNYSFILFQYQLL